MKSFEYTKINEEDVSLIEDRDTEFFETPIYKLKDLIADSGYKTIFDKMSVEFKEFNTREAKAIQKALSSTQHRRRIKGFRVFYKMAVVLQHMIVRLGDDVFFEYRNNRYEEVLSEDKRIAILKNMVYADVIALYFMLAHQTLDHKNNILETSMDIDGQKSVPVSFDLNECEILGTDILTEALWVYNLEVPFKIRGKVVDKIVMGPGPFRSYINIPLSPDEFGNYDFTEGVVGCIYNIPALGDDRPALDPMEIEGMHIQDLKAISEKIGDRACGINQSVIVSEIGDVNQKHDMIVEWWDSNFLI